jgi:molybdopterin converting factor small subunit
VQIAAGRNCPRKFLINAHTQLLDQPNPRALENVNTVDEYQRAMDALTTPQRATSERQIRVQYYALLREQAGRSDEIVITGARDARELYAELRTRYPFTLPAEMLRVAINAEFGEWSQPLAAGDAVVFIPPVAGG